MANGQQGAATMAATDETSAQQPAAPQKSGPKPGSAKAAVKEKKLVGIAYEVSVTHCLLGTRRVIVDPKFLDDALGAKAEAINLYKGNAIRSFEHQPDVKLIGPVYEEVG